MTLTIYTGGTFDLPHSGHVNFLRECAKLGEVTVSLNTDEFIADYKGKPPIMTYAERLGVLAEFRCVKCDTQHRRSRQQTCDSGSSTRHHCYWLRLG